MVLHYIGLTAFGVPRMSWRYIGIGDVGRIFVATAASTTILVLVRMVGPFVDVHAISLVVIPLGVLAMNFVLALLALVSIRMLRRMQG